MLPRRGRRTGKYLGPHTPSTPREDIVVSQGVPVPAVVVDEEPEVPTYYSADESDEDTEEAPRAASPVVTAEDAPVPEATEAEQVVASVEAEPVEGVIGSVMERLDAAGVATFGEAYAAAREQARSDAREILDEADVPLEAKEAIARVEGELGDEIALVTDKVTLLRVQIAEKGMRALEGTLYFVKNGVPELAKTGLELLDLHTKERAYAALLEIIPTVSFWYAVTGKRIKFKEGAAVPTPEFEDIDKMDRLLYLAGSIFFLGHIYSGVRHALLKKGFFTIVKKKGIVAAAKAMLPALQQLVGPTVARAQQYGIRQLTKDRTKKPTPAEEPQPQEGDVKPE